MKRLRDITNGLMVGALLVLVILAAVSRSPLTIEWVLP